MTRNFGLDLIRAISIWLVLIYHAGVNIPGLEPLSIGQIGVEIFFVLSGFLIGGILFKEIDKNNSLFITLKTFWTRRWFRIIPLYYAVLAFKFLAIDDSVGWNLVYYILFLQNNFYGIQFLSVSWSLVIEEWFYLFSPVFLFYCTRIFKTEKGIAFSIVAFILFVVAIRAIYVIHGNVPFSGVNSNFPFRVDSLFIGVLLSFINFKKWQLFNFLSSIKVMIAGFILFFGYLFYYWTQAFPVDTIDEVYFFRILGFLILPLSIGLIIPAVSRFKFNLDRNKVTRGFKFFITWTSVLTYAIYLIHGFVYSKASRILEEDQIFILNVLSFITTYILSWLIYRYFEKPILDYRDKITGYYKKK